MSRVYFHSPSKEVELRGSERAWLNHLASGPGEFAWDLDRVLDHLERITEILAMVPEVPDGEFGGNYLHTYLREAQEQDRRNREIYESIPAGAPLRTYGADHGLEKRLIEAFKTRLRVQGVTLKVAGHELHSNNVELNTALVAGSDPIRLAAKIHGWCEVHAWVDGPDREWMAEVITEGLKTGLYRPDTQGWEEIQTFLRERDDEPVVMSYSVCEPFPDPYFCGWFKDYPNTTEEEGEAHDRRYEAWGELPDDECWDLAMKGLKQQRPWAQITPDNLATESFGPMVTVYDLFAPDRDERVQKAFAEADSDD